MFYHSSQMDRIFMILLTTVVNQCTIGINIYKYIYISQNSGDDDDTNDVYDDDDCDDDDDE